MKKKLLMIVLIVMSIGLISGVFIMKIGNRELKIENANDNVVQEKEKDKKSTQEKEPEELEKVDEEKDSSKEDKTDYKNNTKVETNDTSSTINAEKEELNKTPVQPDNNNTSVVEKTEWEKLGISEYEFYNSPAWNWQNVDFGINLTDDKKCNNETECLTKCQNYGEEYIKTHSGGYRCTNVLSYSGKYLGEDFEYFELQP